MGEPWVFRLCKRGISGILLISSSVSQPNKHSITNYPTNVYKFFDKSTNINVKCINEFIL